ncbi:tRNA pseudouridine synthase-like 1 [Lacerta agilis]|uniref:tRNA pseudouridine synthase-like 1 n=1 Tax=Lacerta agilis TaxID=80427 RepID=UPI001419C717|nr:tRNA pseudouridine synthase-like 1 [Lacerta agilis]
MVSPKTRYLLFFQYFGTKYSGVQEVPPDRAVLGVQNHLEMAAEKLRHCTPSKFTISSRTDSGVHALCNAAHLDIERPDGKPPFAGNVLTDTLNYHLKPEPIRILGARCVPSTFHARFSARSRTYVYRVATGCSHYLELPVFERKRCWATYRGHLNPLAMQEAAAFLLGTHDFSTFRSPSTELPRRNPVKSLSRVEVRPALGFLSEHSKDSHLRFWEMEFTGPSFLYKQVRRMVGVLVAVGQGRLEPRRVQRLLEIRDLMAYPKNTIAPPDGLFLKDVEYCEADLEISETEAEWQPN